MSRHSRHPELHRSERVGWLRAAVLGPTMALSRWLAWWLVWPPAALRPARSWPPVWPAPWPARCRWPPANTSRCRPRPTPKTPTWRWKSASCTKTRTANWKSWPESTATAAWTRRWHGRWLSSSPHTMHWGARPRRTGHHRYPARAPVAGGVGFGWSLHLRRRAAGADVPARPGGQGCDDHHRQHPAGPVPDRCDGGPRRRRTACPRAIRVMFWGALAMAAAAGVGRLFGAHVA